MGKKKKMDLMQKREELQAGARELGAELKQYIERERAAMEKREKSRAAEILGVFARHNFYTGGLTPLELRTTLEDLGPTYVKIGQIMSSRPDLLPEAYCRELTLLRQSVKPLDPLVVRGLIEQETGKKIEDIYSEFQDEPLGSASIAQAHFGILRDGTKVVTKVQRPLIAEMMRRDFVLLRKIASVVNVVGEKEDGANSLDLISVIQELETVTEEELDFHVEAEHTRAFREKCIEDEKKVSCPTIIDALTTSRILTMTYVDGYSISQKDRMLQDGVDPMAVGQALVENYVHQVLDVGMFHGDPHQGNIMISGGIPYWIDFGMVGSLSEADVSLMQDIVMALIEGDLDALVNGILSMGTASSATSRSHLMEDVDVMFSKYMNVTSVADLDMAVLMQELMDAAARNHITIPGRYTMLCRSLTTIEGVIEELCPTLNLFEIISGRLMERARKSFDVKQQLTSAGREALSTGRKAARIPVLAADALSSIVKGRTKINLELTGYDELLRKANRTARHLLLGAFSCALFFGSSVLCLADIQPKAPNGMPLIAAAGLVFSIGLGIHTVRKISKE